MNIDKAIKTLEDNSAPPELLFTTDYCNAVKLSYEALKRFKLLRDLLLDNTFTLLPGETID